MHWIPINCVTLCFASRLHTCDGGRIITVISCVFVSTGGVCVLASGMQLSTMWRVTSCVCIHYICTVCAFDSEFIRCFEP